MFAFFSWNPWLHEPSHDPPVASYWPRPLLQILLILRHKSVEGLAMASFEIECVGYTVAVSYCLYKQLPFSTYGELFFLLLQGK